MSLTLFLAAAARAVAYDDTGSGTVTLERGGRGVVAALPLLLAARALAVEGVTYDDTGLGSLVLSGSAVEDGPATSGGSAYYSVGSSVSPRILARPLVYVDYGIGTIRLTGDAFEYVGVDDMQFEEELALLLAEPALV